MRHESQVCARSDLTSHTVAARSCKDFTVIPTIYSTVHMLHDKKEKSEHEKQMHSIRRLARRVYTDSKEVSIGIALKIKYSTVQAP